MFRSRDGDDGGLQKFQNDGSTFLQGDLINHPFPIASSSAGTEQRSASHISLSQTASPLGNPLYLDQHERIPLPPLRTVSREGSLLRHPVPDLQSGQGAYIGNVKRLEQSAERISLSADMAEEVKKICDEQKKMESRRNSSVRGRRLSQGSHTSHSILGVNNLARMGGLSPGAYVTSPAESLRSPSWTLNPSRSQSNSKPGSHASSRAGQGLDTLLSPSLPADETRQEILNPLIEKSNSSNDHSISNHQGLGSHEPALLPPSPRPEAETANLLSSENVDHIISLFANFDGVHREVTFGQPSGSDQALLDMPGHERRPMMTRPKSYLIPPAGAQNLVYYPAPVPMLLNLPPKLSKNPQPHRDLRRSQMLGAPSTSHLRPTRIGVEGSSGNVDHRRATKLLPPHLRANLFFEMPSAEPHIVLQNGSAVDTLDRILDASASAPVNAFTDHPIVGHVGAEVYGKSGDRNTSYRQSSWAEDQRKSTVSLLNTRQNSAPAGTSQGGKLAQMTSRLSRFLPGDRAGTDLPQASEYYTEGEDEDEDEDEDQRTIHEHLPANVEQGGTYHGQPTTLLAELQLRKQEQQQRNRNAVTGFPNGMHSTLLELDAVAQVQQRSRKQQRVMLAWEDHAAKYQDQGDEDVPLGILFPGGKVKSRNDDNYPLGLRAQREREDNEPLSHRRARLRGEKLPEPKPAGEKVPLRTASPKRQISMYTLEVPGLTDEPEKVVSEDENETLAQRARRLKAAKARKSQPASSDFASEVFSHLGDLSADKADESSGIAKSRDTPEPEETLGQRRRRLQAERLAKAEQNEQYIAPTAAQVQRRLSMADVLHAHPVNSRPLTHPRGMTVPLNGTYERAPQIQHAPYGTPIMPGYPAYLATTPVQATFGQQIAPSYYNPLLYSAMVPTTYVGTARDMGMRSSMPPPALGQRNQRDRIDQWRQSVL